MQFNYVQNADMFFKRDVEKVAKSNTFFLICGMSRLEMITNYEFQHKVRRPSLTPEFALHANIDKIEGEKIQICHSSSYNKFFREGRKARVFTLDGSSLSEQLRTRERSKISHGNRPLRSLSERKRILLLLWLLSTLV